MIGENLNEEWLPEQITGYASKTILKRNRRSTKQNEQQVGMDKYNENKLGGKWNLNQKKMNE